jgi:hypothetical protein
MISHDSGSTVHGFSLAFLALDFFRAVASANSLPFFPLIFAVIPVLDGAFAVLRRLRSGGSPLSGDRFHLYDLLLTRGSSERKVALTCYLLTGALVAAGRWSVRFGFAQGVMILMICFGALLAAGLLLGSLSSSVANLKQQEENAAVLSRDVQSAAEGLIFCRK